MLQMPGHELLLPDEAETGLGGAGTARSGASSFRQSSARWRTPREHIDNSDFSYLLKSARGRTSCKLSAEQEACRRTLANEAKVSRASCQRSLEKHSSALRKLTSRLSASQPSAGTTPHNRLTATHLTGRRASLPPRARTPSPRADERQWGGKGLLGAFFTA
jgi:hypothetical protein